MRETCVCGAALHVDERETTLSARSLVVLAEYWRRVHAACKPATAGDPVKSKNDGGSQ